MVAQVMTPEVATAVEYAMLGRPLRFRRFFAEAVSFGDGGVVQLRPGERDELELYAVAYLDQSGPGRAEPKSVEASLALLKSSVKASFAHYARTEVRDVENVLFGIPVRSACLFKDDANSK